jgi:hypothetical protein
MPRAFKPHREERQREDRIANEILVDAYNQSERALSWYYYLERRLRFPFAARCTHLEEESPLRRHGIVQVIGLAKADRCTTQVLVKVVHGQRSIEVPLWQLDSMASDQETNDAVADWHYWVYRAYHY